MASLRDTLVSLFAKESPSAIQGTPLGKAYPNVAQPEQPLEAPLLSPDDLIGTGIGKAALVGAGKVAPLLAGMIKNPSVEKALVNKTAQELAHEEAQKKAVKLLGLKPDNTAFERARAMGYPTAPSERVYHYAKQDWESNVIDPTKSDLGFHVGNVDQANHRAKIFGGGLTDNGEWVSGMGEGSNIIPLLKSKYSYMLPVKDEGSFHADAIAHQLEKKGVLPKGYTEEALSDPLGDISAHGWDVKYDQSMRDALEKKGYHGVKYKNAHEGEGTSYAFIKPNMLRSPFAAFNPALANSSDIMADEDINKRNQIIDLLKNK